MDADPPIPSFRQIIGSYAFRVGIYGVLTLLSFEVVYAVIMTYGADRVSAENGVIEVTQVLLAIVGSVGLFCAARWTTVGRSALIVTGALVTYAAARESDLLFESLLFDDAYKWVVGLPMAAYATAVVLADRRHFIGELMVLMRHPAATLFMTAGIFLCTVCQTLDRPQLWIASETDANMATMKVLIEEYCELFAYLLIAFSGIEAAILARHRRREAASRSRESAVAKVYRHAA